MDKTACKAHTAKDAEEMQIAFAKKGSMEDRLKYAAYLISVAYGFEGKAHPRMDRTKFSAKSSNDARNI